MIQTVFRALLILFAGAFTVVFAALCIPPLMENPDILGAFASGFVNPYAAGYSLDVFFTYGVLAAWVLYEAKARGIRHGWIALALGIVPGVAAGLAVYLLLRLKQTRAGA